MNKVPSSERHLFMSFRVDKKGTMALTVSTALSTRYGSDRRLAELSDYRRLSESQLSFRRSPTKSSLDYRRLPDAHSDYARYSGSYNDYLRAAQMHSGYQRRM